MSFSLIFEAGRIAAGLTDCVMYNPFPEISAGAQLPLHRLLSGYRQGICSLNELYDYVERLERWAEEEARVFRTPDVLREYCEIKPVPFCFIINRIISSPRLEFAPEMQFYLVRAGRERAIAKMLSKIRNAEKSAIKKSDARKIARINEIEGRMLGYPDCCVNAFVELKKGRMEGKDLPSPERVIAEEFVERGLAELTVRILEGEEDLPDESYSLFATNFYPCSLLCPKALEAGRRYREFLDKTMHGLFIAGIAANLASILVVCFNMHLKGYFASLSPLFSARSVRNLAEEYSKNPSAFHSTITRRFYQTYERV
ncbi:DUF483 domain-containing protein [Archaeoglobus veneficus]|uniref:DUF483 domain-containing protein n=1 Tax=Archaeoglobus veneficus (strain DSM 11195 / SNP6) TaxID=693661 RepID=F2KS47_ARCVS|nr:DUF483 domain-containing protein [Archaeoglobus veneficus]AEA47986.1 hypothetical protein Arcve_1993 [Archaeoglobus veneficus SNP6]